jgi:hypothetical protein
LNPAALSVIRIEQPALVGVDEATVPDFLKPSRA